MATNSISDFIVKSEGHCFLCLSEVSPKLTAVKVEPDAGIQSTSKFQVEQSVFHANHSLQYLSHCLKLNLGAVPVESINFSQKSLKAKCKMSSSKLNLALCEGCAALNGRFSELYKQLETIQMEVTACIRAIHEKMIQPELEVKSTISTTDTLLNECLGEDDFKILEAVRKTVMRKCSLKLKRISPRVEITKLEETKLQNASATREEMEVESSPQLDIDLMNVVNVKVENDIILTSDLEDEANSIHFNAFTPGDSSREPGQETGTTSEAGQETDNIHIKNKTTKRSPRTEHEISVERNPTTGKFKCPACDKEFTEAASARKHYRSFHLKQKSSACEICGKRFSLQGSLSTHRRFVHLNLKPHRCNKCGMEFSYISHLKTHQRSIHLKLKPHQCEECRTGFTSRDSLESHRQEVHLKLKPHQCDDCGARFGRKTRLVRHQRSVHLKIKPWICPDCGRQFSRKGHLTGHQEAVHLKLKPSQSNQCDNNFSTVGHIS